MSTHTEQLLKGILETLDKLEYIKSDEIPNIDLYMDQVTTFMDGRLRHLARYPEEDKVMTKTMINNYAKNDLLPPPFRKKYSKEHMMLLLFIYYFKGFLSISDIQTLLRPITEKYFQNGKEFDLSELYETVFSMEEGEIEFLKNDLQEKYKIAQSVFNDAPEDREFLQKFAFICLLSYDVYFKKSIIEKIIDDLSSNMEPKAASKETK